MNKHVVAFLVGVIVLAGSVSCASAATAYVTADDIRSVQSQLDNVGYTYCPTYWTNRDDANDTNEEYRAYRDWYSGLGLHTSVPRGGYDRYSIAFKGRAISVAIPYSSSWSLQSKQVRPYLLVGDRVADVGPLGFLHEVVQDDVCRFDRAYRLTLEKGTIKTLESSMKKQVAQLQKDDATTDETRDLPTVMLGTSMGMVPTIIENSGGYTAQYDRVSVNISGGWVLTVSSKGGYNATVDTNMLRIAASAR